MWGVSTLYGASLSDIINLFGNWSFLGIVFLGGNGSFWVLVFLGTGPFCTVSLCPMVFIWQHRSGLEKLWLALRTIVHFIRADPASPNIITCTMPQQTHPSHSHQPCHVFAFPNIITCIMPAYTSFSFTSALSFSERSNVTQQIFTFLVYHQARFFLAKSDKSAFVEPDPPPQLDSLPFLKSSGGEVEVLEWRHFGNLLVPRPMEGLR